jgi:Rps23 Pro-64 3,4-dihydroxylase Tpa1-like proline 4-hydroxylase
VVDLLKQTQFIEEGDNVCTDIRKEAEKTNLKLELLQKRIKESTWDKMHKDYHSKAMKSVQNDTLLYNFSIRNKTDHEVKTLSMLVVQRKIELMEKYRRIENKLKECINMRDFSHVGEGFFMNRMAGKPSFMTDESIAEAAAEFARKDAEKKMRKNQAE